MVAVPASISGARDAQLIDVDAGGDITLGDLVYMSADGAERASSTDPATANVLGMVVSGVAYNFSRTEFTSGDRVTVARSGKVTGFSGLVQGGVLYLGVDGAVAAAGTIQVAVALDEVSIVLALGGGGGGLALPSIRDFKVCTNYHMAIAALRPDQIEIDYSNGFGQSEAFLRVKKLNDDALWIECFLPVFESPYTIPAGETICIIPQSERPASNRTFIMLVDQGPQAGGPWRFEYHANTGALAVQADAGFGWRWMYSGIILLDTAIGIPNAGFTIDSGEPLTLAAVDDQAATVGTAFSFTPHRAAGGTQPVTYAVSGLPSWATFDAATRTISGTPAASSDNITYTGTDSSGASVSSTFALTAS